MTTTSKHNIYFVVTTLSRISHIFHFMSFISIMKSLSSVFFFALIIYQVLSKNDIAKPRIVGGEACDVEDNAPFAVTIYSIVMCGGALIKPLWILTAAHCIIDDYVDRVEVIARVGFNSRSDLIQERVLSRFRLYDNYDKSLQDSESDMRFDIGLAGMDKRFDPSPVAQLAKLPEVGDTANCLTALAVGIGLTSPNEEINMATKEGLLDRPLMCVDLSLIHSVEDCRNAYPKAEIDDTVFCASSSGKDTCLGDSGGPLICDGKVIGVISYGPKDCGSPSGTAIYTKVESYLGYIENKTSMRRLEPRRQRIGTANSNKHICRWNLIFFLALEVVLYY